MSALLRYSLTNLFIQSLLCNVIEQFSLIIHLKPV